MAIMMYRRSRRRRPIMTVFTLSLPALFMSFMLLIATLDLLEYQAVHVEAFAFSAFPLELTKAAQVPLAASKQKQKQRCPLLYGRSSSPRQRRSQSSSSDSSGTVKTPGTLLYSSVSAAESDPRIVDSPTTTTTTTTTAETALGDDINNSTTSSTTSSSSSNNPYEYVIPSYRTLLIFFSTTTFIWLSEPLLSLVDTTVVGLYGGGTGTGTGSGSAAMGTTTANAVLQLAAMGPATTLVDAMMYTTYFLALATTNMLARSLAGAKDYRSLLKTTSHVLGVATVLGCIVTVLLFTAAGPSMLTRMVGTNAAAASPQLVHYAVRYAQIRGLAAVCSVWQMVGQSFCLTVGDNRTPVIAVVTASCLNIVGDLLLRKRGMQGAAAATAVAVTASAGILMSAVWRQVKEWRVLLVEQEQRMEQTKKNKQRQEEHMTALVSVVDFDPPFLAPAKSRRRQSSTLIEVNMNTTQAFGSTSIIRSTEMQITGPTESKSPAVIPFMSLPDRESLVELVKLSGPLFFNMMGKIVCYSALTVRCTAYGVVPLAAHTIMMRFFFLYGCFGYSVGQTAQAFLPAAVYPTENKLAVRRILRRLSMMAAVVAVSNSLLVAWNVRALGRFLTADVAVVQAMRDHAVYLGAAIFLHPFIELLEGVVVATRQFRTLILTYVVTVAAHLTTLLCLCRSFTSVWQALVAFQLVRLTNFSLRAWNKKRTATKLDLQLPGKTQSKNV
jgi:Na+-driven multidrug efflux pump